MKVRKEATVAVVIGLIIALLVTGGILRARTALDSIKLPTKESFSSSKTTKPENEKNQELFLELTTPDNIVLSEPVLNLLGKTLPSTYIAILGEKGEYLIVPNELGNFSQDISLVQGANTIKITVFMSDGTKVEKTLNAVYTTAQL